MQTKKIFEEEKKRQLRSGVNWKQRKQRLKGFGQVDNETEKWPPRSFLATSCWPSSKEGLKKTAMIDVLRTNSSIQPHKNPHPNLASNSNSDSNSNPTPAQALSTCVTFMSRHGVHARASFPTQKDSCALIVALASIPLMLMLMLSMTFSVVVFAQQAHPDPRPTIYSGQVSFGLLLSAHSSLGSELSTSASHRMNSILTVSPSIEPPEVQSAQDFRSGSSNQSIISLEAEQDLQAEASIVDTMITLSPTTTTTTTDEDDDGENDEDEDDHHHVDTMKSSSANLNKRQIFDRTHQPRRQSGSQQQKQSQQNKSIGKPAQQQQQQESCSLVNPNALYAGMGAIWASHQANLVGDSQLSIGTYVYDSCNDLEVGQRQSVRIVSNLNAFQQTTCEAPRGSPISVTIAHGDQQLRAIQLLTSFKVPVITTKEHFELEDYSSLSRDQKRYLFTTAASSRHLAVGALRFSKRIISRTISSPKLPNQFHKMSSKNGLIVISRNLPAKFITYLIETIPNHVNYEMLQSSQPIDQVRSVEVLETILKTGQSSLSESKVVKTFTEAPDQLISNLRRRSDPDSDSADSTSSDTDSSSPSSESMEGRMLSPTILMFITPAEAIDLVTRLRNDLAEVSRYYSLIVSTREDISPALKTIFHRGGSRLCSGKSFYAISPKPNDINEFSRYFRDTVQMEGETSDHPLICEFAKYQASSKISADLDDVSTEPIIKAVWAAAAAFKNVYSRECAIHNVQGNLYTSKSESHSRQSQRQANNGNASQKSAHQECLLKMNKNMSHLVQKALKKLDVHINSTGLQALDGFRIKFDDMNELMTNKYSIKYINKECEITEIGQFSGFKDSALQIDEDLLPKSLESILPDPWPASVTPPTKSSTTSTSSTSASSDSGSSETPTSGTSSSSGDSNNADSDTVSSDNPAPDKHDASASEEAGRQTGDPELDSDFDDSSKKSTNKRPKTDEDRLKRRQQSSKPKMSAPLMALGGRGVLPGVADTDDAKVSPSAPTSATSTEQVYTTIRPMRKLKPFPTTMGNTVKDWLPKTEVPTTRLPAHILSSLLPTKILKQTNENEQIDPKAQPDLRMRATTQEPIYSTLPESGGNTDIDSVPAVKSTEGRFSPKLRATTSKLETAATTESSDHITIRNMDRAPSNNRQGSFAFDGQSVSIESDGNSQPMNRTSAPLILAHRSNENEPGIKFNYMRDLTTSPMPLGSTSRLGGNHLPEPIGEHQYLSATSSETAKIRPKERSQLRWIYSSWFALTILAANICGAILTLYVLTFLLMKNCDGSLDRENQGIRSLHLLAIILVFFGSTLFIVYPTPGLCLLRTSWHNFALVMMFGTLLLQTMQLRAQKSIGLGGRTNRLNQFLTLMFMVGVQVAYELQRWKYESANYLNFVNQYFGSSESGDKKLMIFSSTMMANSFNTLNTLSDQIAPVSIQVSERYQSLLYDYCNLTPEELLQSQIHLWIIIGLLVLFSFTIRNSGQLSSHHKLSTGLTSGKLVATQHEANLTDLNSSQFQFAPNLSPKKHLPLGYLGTKGVFTVTVISVPIYFISIILHVHGQNIINNDLVSSVTLVLIAFTTLIGIFMPILRQEHSHESLISDPLTSTGSLARPVIHNSTQSKHRQQQQLQQQQQQQQQQHQRQHSNSAFDMFPEFAPTGLRRPGSLSGDSSSGAGSRHPFAESKESRRQMGIALANLGPSADSLRSMGVYGTDRKPLEQPIDPALINLKLNLNGGADDELSPIMDDLYKSSLSQHHQHNKRHSHQQRGQSRQSHQSDRRSTGGEKRLIMLDVDPCCPRHGVSAWPRSGSGQGPP